MREILKKYRNVVLRVFDVIIIIIAYFISFLFINYPMYGTYRDNMEVFLNTVVISLIVYTTILNVCRTYKNITRYENGNDYLIYIAACFIAYLIVFTVGSIFTTRFLSVRVVTMAALIIVVSIIGYRVLLRFYLNRNSQEESNQPRKNVLIIGAGEAARELLITLRGHLKEIYHVVGFIDDNPYKVDYQISGYKILGTRYDIPRICKEKEVELILFTIANISSKNKKQILNICQETECKVRILPGTKELIKNKNIFENFRDVEIEDLLGREPVKLDNGKIGELIKNKVVLITGGGGSIGSELCRQIIQYKPKTLVIVDIYENNLYDIEQELRFNFPDMDIKAIVASVRDKERLNEIFEEFKPYLVFHAAAHKHVPLMETSPLEAIKNNVFGTYNVMNCSDEYKVKRCILISTDKAVNPTNIMGATKRLCEMIIQAKNKNSETEFAAVRFGNVLGSNGSVIPLFKKQIAKGGPVTVTHKDITRFFMTIPEAVSLVLQAMSYAKGGEIFVLDMGEPVKIYDMAVNLIKLMGYEPDVDMKIKITGLRPGEKLYEEVLMEEEGLKSTEHEKIHVAALTEVTEEELDGKLTKLRDVLKDYKNNEIEAIRKVFRDIVPTYKPAKEFNKIAEEKMVGEIIEEAVAFVEPETEKARTTQEIAIEKSKKIIELNKEKDKEKDKNEATA